MAQKDINSLDYLLDDEPSPGGKSAERSGVSPPAPAALQAFASTQVLQVANDLEDAAGGNHVGVLLSQIDERLRMGALALVPSVQLLVEAGLLQITETRAFDDHRVTVTDEGAALLVRERQPELLKRLGAA